MGGGSASGTKAIVAIADEPISALSVLPKNAAEAETKYYVIRVKKRKPSDKQLTEIDQFETLGCLHVDNDVLSIHNQDQITLNVSSNYNHAWIIYALDNATDGEHSRLVIKNASNGKYISNSTTDAVHLTAKIAVDVDGDDASNYFTMKPYADHFEEKIELNKYEYDHYEGTDKCSETKDGHTIYYIKRRVDLIDHKKHHIYLNGSYYKIHCDKSNDTYHVAMADSRIAGFNDYDDNGAKDDIVFEIVEVEVADATNTVTYKFNVSSDKGVAYHFYLQNNHVDEFASPTIENIKSHFGTELTYYNNFSNIQATTSSEGFKHVEVDCNPNFPFLLSKELRSFDDASMAHPLNFFTMSAGAPDDKTDGYYVGLENANSGDHDKMIKHGHYNGTGSSESDFSPYYETLMTDFHRHIDGSLFWYACKATDEINDPNALRIYLFTTTTHPLIATDDIHDSGYNDPEYKTYKAYDLKFLEDRASASHNECNHDVFQILPNTISGMDKGFTLQLKSDNSLKIATTHDGTGEPDKSFLKIARGASATQTRLSANSATDLVNVAINSRGTKNVGGLDKEEFEGWVEDLMIQYRLAYLYPQATKYPNGYEYYDGLNTWIPGWIDYNRLYNLAAILEYYPDYTTFDINKKYRIELYKEGTGDNKMLSSFESFMNDGCTTIAGNNMQNAKSATSIINDATWTAADASTYWQIYPTADKTPESGEEVEIAIYNSNVGAFLTQTNSGVEFASPCAFNEANAKSATKFYVKQEDTSDQWVILNHRSTAAEVKKLIIADNGQFAWQSGYTHGAVIKDYQYDNNNQNHGRWMFSEIAQYPMSVSSVGWASVCLPFPVTFPKSDVKAAYYTASLMKKDKDDTGTGYEHNMILADITAASDGKYSIPANTAFIVNTDGAKTIQFTVDDTNKNSFSMTSSEQTSNLFKSVNAQWGHSGYSGGGKVEINTYYGLGNQSPHGVAFYPIVARGGEECFLPANKAYLDLNQIQTLIGQLSPQAAAKARFMFVLPKSDDGMETYIDPVTWQETKVPADGLYYDLSGRKVTNPKRGIYVTSNGKKIVVK